MKLNKIFLILLVSIFGASIASCDTITSGSDVSTSSEESSSSVSLPDWVDYSNNVSLGIDYRDESGKTRDFTVDGITQVSLRMVIDGDTAHFDNPYETVLVGDTYSTVLKIRFYGIDTPESTTTIEEWGKQASVYTKGILKTAAEEGTIVISNPSLTYTKPSFDSTGTRYLGLVWVNETVKDAPYTSLKLLNLMIVENGYSSVKNLSAIPEFVDTFIAAESQAKTYKLKMWSGETDPMYNYNGAQEISLLELKYAIIETMQVPDFENPYDGGNYKIYGTVAGYADNTLFIQKYFSKADGSEKDEGEYASLNIFTGMGSLATRFKKVNSYVMIIGTFQVSENFGMQLTNASFPAVTKAPTDCDVIYKPDAIPEELKVNYFESTITDLSSKVPNVQEADLDWLYSPVIISDEVTVTGGYVSSSSSTDITLYVSPVGTTTKLNVNVYLTFLYYGDPVNHPYDVWNSVDRFMGKAFKLQGIFSCYFSSTTSKYYFQIILRDADDFVCQNL